MSKHTPGPWEVSERAQMRVNVKTGSLLHPCEPRVATAEDLEEFGDECHDDWNICQCDDEHYMRDPKECEANARLIAAAPELLAACQKLIVWFDTDREQHTLADILKAIRAAIAKATADSRATTQD